MGADDFKLRVSSIRFIYCILHRLCDCWLEVVKSTGLTYAGAKAGQLRCNPTQAHANSKLINRNLLRKEMLTLRDMQQLLISTGMHAQNSQKAYLG